MTEREKMLAGLDYNSRDPELLNDYHTARALMQTFNQLASTNLPKRQEILGALLGAVGDGVWIEPPFFCDYGKYINIGTGTFVNGNCFFLDNNTITIGSNGLIGPHVQIYTASHPLRASERIVTDTDRGPYRTHSKVVTIGDKVWIGGNTVIMPGVTIGNEVVIGAGSVVTKNIPDRTLAFGNPCNIIRSLEG